MQQVTKRFISTYSKQNKKPSLKKQDVYTQDIAQKSWDILMSAHNAWQSLAGLRREVRRNEEFLYGDQHSDKVFDYHESRWITERKLLEKQGLQPSQYNIIRSIVRSIEGVWGSNKTLPTCVAQKENAQEISDILTATLHAHYRKHKLWRMDMVQLRQLLLSGIIVSKSHYQARNNDKDVFTDYIDFNTFFIDNTMKDPRYTDCSIVGCFHDMPIRKIAGLFANGSKKRAQRIRAMYNGDDIRDAMIYANETFTDERLEEDFFIPKFENQDLGRVFEVWRRETKECYWIHDRLQGEYYADFEVTESELQRLNQQRIEEQAAMGVLPEDMLLYEWDWATDDFIFYYYLTPWGEVLDSGMSPFWHNKFPFVFELHDFVNGKIYPFIKDLIDTQKQINKLSAISELLTKHSAKDLLFFPVDQIADEEGYDMDYIQQAVTSYDAIIPFKQKPGQDKPFYVNTISQAFTPLNVVNMYLQLAEKTSGVYGALQGQTPASGTPAQMYAQQSQNSATSLIPLFECMSSYRVERDKMNVQLMQQYYEDNRYIFEKDSGKRLIWKPEKVKNIDFEISVVENTDTPAYRMMITDLLFQLKNYDAENQLDLRGLIEVSALPFKEQLLNYLNERQQQMEDAMASGGQMPQGGLPPELAQQLQGYQFSPELQQQYQEGMAEHIEEMYPPTRSSMPMR